VRDCCDSSLSAQINMWSGGSAFEKSFWADVLALLGRPNDCFAFSLVSRLFASIFSESSDDRKMEFLVSIDLWLHPKKLFRKNFLPTILPNGSIHGTFNNVSYIEGRAMCIYDHDSRMVGAIRVSSDLFGTRWTSMISDWTLRFIPCSECLRGHLLMFIDPMNSGP
jgi:hypothetical protein